MPKAKAKAAAKAAATIHIARNTRAAKKAKLQWHPTRLIYVMHVAVQMRHLMTTAIISASKCVCTDANRTLQWPVSDEV